MLVGNNANEGPGFTPQNITTEADLVAWLELTFSLFTNDDIAKVLLYYPSSNASTNRNATLFATEGDVGITALNQSSVGTGQQQRANVGSSTFTGPSSMLELTNALCRTYTRRPHLSAQHTGWPRLTTTTADQRTNINTLCLLQLTHWMLRRVCDPS
jgi:hypothetical protein